MLYLPFFVFILGLFIGSFLNVVILRMNTGRSAVTGRSSCARCARPLSWYELLPVVSFLGLRGKCRTCRLPISFQYPVVELVTAIIFTILYTELLVLGGFTALTAISFVFSCAIAAILIVIFAYDLRHKIIPDMAVYSFILLSIVSVVYKALIIPGFALGVHLVAGVVVALPFFALWFFSKGRLMGFGDVKFALGMGWLLGISAGFSAVFLAFWIGALVGLFVMAVSRKHHLKSEIPFAPFLIIGTFIAGVWDVTLTSLLGVWL